MALILPAFGAGRVPTGTDYAQIMAAITQAYGIWAVKAADNTPVNNSTTLVNDAELFVPVAANTVYDVVAKVFYTTGATPDIKLGFTFPSGTMSWAGVGAVDSLSAATTNATVADNAWTSAASGQTLSFGGGVGSALAVLAGTLRVGPVAGNLQLQFAQATANASNTLTKADSSLRVWPQ